VSAPGPAGPSLQTGIRVTSGPSGDSNVDASQTSFLCQDRPGYACPRLPQLSRAQPSAGGSGETGSTEARGRQSSREIQSTITRRESSARTGPRNSCFHYSNERQRLGARWPFAARERVCSDKRTGWGLRGKPAGEVLPQPWPVTLPPATTHRRHLCSPEGGIQEERPLHKKK